VITKETLDILRTEALNRHTEYIEAEKRLWESKNGFADIALYKTYKKAKSIFM